MTAAGVPPKRLHEFLDGVVLAEDFERYAADAERAARELAADDLDNADHLLPRMRAEAQALRLAAAVAGGRLRFCNICGGVVDLTGADRPSVKVGVGAPLKHERLGPSAGDGLWKRGPPEPMTRMTDG